MEKVVSIVVTYNGMQWIDRCLQSLHNSNTPNSVIVIDNGSTDGTFLHIETNYSSVYLIKADKNLGFGQGNNIGLKLALKENADFVFLLNQDAWVEEETITDLVKAFSANPDYGIISPVHLTGNGTALDDHFYNYLLQADIHSIIYDVLRCKPIERRVINTPFVNAAAWLISKNCLQKVGGFDPVFFHYGEDDNYVQRATWLGFKTGILPSAFIYHDKIRASGEQPEVKKKIARDWIQLLVYVCNVNDPGYKRILFRKTIRHALNFAYAFCTFNKYKLVYNYGMLKKIFLGLSDIKRSRRLGINAQTPYLT